jgi:ParB family chromosome partitioning protein
MKHGLGRGMLALIDENISTEIDKGQVNSIDINKILPNRYQPRKNFDENALKELADSIREKGVIQPIIVSDLGNGTYELVAGERRWRAAKMADLMEIPCIIKDFTDEDRLEIALIENIQRQELNSIEEALAYKEIMDRLGCGQDEVAKKVGKNRSSVANTLRLLRLPETIREKVATGEITEGHARAVLTIEDLDRMIGFTHYIIEKGLSVREAEREAKTFSVQETKNVSRETKKKDRSLHEIEEKFIQKIGAKVEIKGTSKKGRIEIHYFSKDELENIFHSIASR